MQLGQHAAPSHVIAHLSDPHLLADGRRMFGTVDSTGHLVAMLEQLEASGLEPDAIVFTGDLADRGEVAAYATLRALVEPVAARLGAAVVWVMGNHDERGPYAQLLFDEFDELDGVRPQDRVYDVRGLRIISLDTSVPGYHHGDLEPAQLDWLRAELAVPAPHGTLLALHHPPMPSPLDISMELLELLHQDRLADAIRGTDVRGILAGHLHFSSHSTFAGVPVSVASAGCYTMALARADVMIGGYDAFQSYDAVHVFPDRLVHTQVPLGDGPLVSGFPISTLGQLAALPADVRHELFSWKASGLDPAEVLSGDADALARAAALIAAELERRGTS
ncbi:MAG TPA: metallophosphoesterase [Microbacteriaceae bacterium]|nr:metallophosphoesterase [Microbacteriaceae bacterium]